MRKISKKNTQLFHKKIDKLLKEYGVKEGGILNYKYTLDTQYGLWYITYHDEEYYTYSIYTMFDEPGKAKKVFLCNPYNGKDNIFMSSINDAIEALKGMIIKARVEELQKV